MGRCARGVGGGVGGHFKCNKTENYNGRVGHQGGTITARHIWWCVEADRFNNKPAWLCSLSLCETFKVLWHCLRFFFLRQGRALQSAKSILKEHHWLYFYRERKRKTKGGMKMLLVHIQPLVRPHRKYSSRKLGVVLDVWLRNCTKCSLVWH